MRALLRVKSAKHNLCTLFLTLSCLVLGMARSYPA